jgi:hypothetical protein
MKEDLEQRFEESRALDAAALERQQAARIAGEVLTYTEAMHAELKENPSRYRMYLGSSAEPVRKDVAVTMDGFERTRLSEHFQDLLDKTTKSYPQRKGEPDQVYSIRVQQLAGKNDPVLVRAYHGGGTIGRTNYLSLKQRGVFND